VLLLPVLAVFLGISLHQIDLPGFYYDEALDLTAMLALMQGRAPELLRGIGVGGYPVMLLDYMGSLGGYVTVPFMAVLGPGLVSARVQPIVFSAITILLLFAVGRRWFGTGPALLAALLLAVHPSFIWFTRQGISVTSVMSVFAWLSLYLLTEPSVRGAQSLLTLRPFRWLLSGIVLGLGLWAKLPFLWWLMMLAVMALVRLLARHRRVLPLFPPARACLAGIVGFALGAAPLLYFNLAGVLRDGDAYTATMIFASLLKPTQQFGVNNLDFFNNLSVSWSNFKVFVDGSYFWYNGVTFSNIYALPLLAAALIIGALMIWRVPDVRPFGVRWLALALSLPVAIFMGSFTVSGQWATHFFIISGLPQLLTGCAVAWLAYVCVRWLQARWNTARHSLSAGASALLALALLALPVYQDLWVSWQHHQKLAETGGSGRFSDAVYKIARYLDESRTAEPVALDWGIEKQIRVLTADRVRPVEIFGYSQEPDDGFRARSRDMLQDPNRKYVVLWDQFAVYNRRQEFTRLANEMGRQVTEVFIAHERSGLPVYVVLEAR
jgi:hypothetical protein